jgi:hypothetical protein
LIAARRAANEGSAQSTTRTIHSAQVTYGSTTGNGSYSTSLAALNTANLIDAQVADTTNGKSGYIFDVTTGTGSPKTFAVGATPVSITGLTATGTRNFCVATDGVVYSYAGTNASTTSKTVAGSATVDASCSTTGNVVVQ